jgi:uncharacterized membrane protein YgdD (TMEM256/DUF423 family)
MWLKRDCPQGIGSQYAAVLVNGRRRVRVQAGTMALSGNEWMNWVASAAVFGFLAVLAGAFGAHALRVRLAPELMEIYRTAAQYHLLHALALAAYGVWRERRSGSAWPAWAFLGGMMIFSGSLYLLAILGWRWLGAVTPVGGLALMGGWLGWAWQARRSASTLTIPGRD